MTETVMQLRAAIQRGVERGLWTSIETCAEKLEMNPRTLRGQHGGYVMDGTIVAGTLDRVLGLLGEEIPQGSAGTSATRGSSDSNLVEEVKELFEQGKSQGCWNSHGSCARRIGIPRRTLSNQLSYAGKLGKRAKKSMRATICTMRRELQEAGSTPERHEPQQETAGEALRRGAALLSGVLQAIVADASQQTLQGALCSLEGLLPSALAETIRGVGEQSSPSSAEDTMRDLQEGLRLILQEIAQLSPHATSHEGVVAGTFFDRVLAGVAELQDQNLNGVRFVLNARNFRKLHGAVTREEVEDTGLLIEELVRRFSVFAQLDDVNQRALIAQKLGERLNRLYQTIELSRDVCPTRAAEEIAGDREARNLFIDSQLGEQKP